MRAQMDTRATHVSTERSSVELTDAAIGDIRDGFRGALLRPGDDGYEAARLVWNGMIDRRPALIARCTGTADVAAAVRFARAHGLEIAVRGGGHSVAGHGAVDGGLMIDLSPTSGVRVDPDARRAWVQGGALHGAMDHESLLHGLATTAGTVSHTGVGGLTLGGGYGYLARKHGLACDNLASAEVVTADGDVLLASEDRNPELFWALRGGGGNFGIVTSFEFRLHPVAPMVSTGDLFFDADNGVAALRAFVDFAAEMPVEMTTNGGVATVREEWGIAGLEPGTTAVVLSWFYLGEQDEGRRLASPLYALRPRVESAESMSYRRLQALADATQRHGMRRYWKGSFATTLTDEALAAFVARGAKPGDPAPLWGGGLVSLGGAISQIGEDESAYSGRDAVFDFLSISSWEDPAEDEVRLNGARRFWESMSTFTSSRAYVNSLNETDAGRVRDAYGASKFDRLVALKRRYDPDNVFHLNQNIRPA